MALIKPNNKMLDDDVRKDINNADNPIRKLAIRILEAVAEAYGNPNLFDGSEVINEDGTTTKCEPDGSWYEYEDLVTELILEALDGK